MRYTMRMLSVFPQILFLAPLSATLLRVAAAFTFAYVVWKQAEHREDLARIRFPIVGSGMWIVWLSIIIEGSIALALFVGIYTQVAALLGAIAAAKYVFWKKYAPTAVPLTRGTSLLLLVVTLSLLVTGAGAFAFDLPL